MGVVYTSTIDNTHVHGVEVGAVQPMDRWVVSFCSCLLSSCCLLFSLNFPLPGISKSEKQPDASGNDSNACTIQVILEYDTRESGHVACLAGRTDW